MRAENKFGLGDPSVTDPVTLINPFTVPDSPSKPEVGEVTKNSVALLWQPPKCNGGKPVTNYVVEKKDHKSSRWIRVTSKLIFNPKFKVTGLHKDQEYNFRVRNLKHLTLPYLANTSTNSTISQKHLSFL